MAQRGEGGAEGKGSEVMGRDVWAGLEQLWHCGTGVGLGGGWGRAGWVGRLKGPVSPSLSLGAEEGSSGGTGEQSVSGCLP